MLRRILALCFVLVLTGIVAVTASCGDGGSGPRAGPGYYQLVAINGQPLPFLSPPSNGLSWQIWRGDLVLRTDGTFMQGVGANLSFLLTADGSYSLSEHEIAFRPRGASPGPDDLIGTVSQDSIYVTITGLSSQPMHFAFRRASLRPSSIPSSHYHLTSVDGRTGDPIVVSDTTINGTRYIERVMFDSLMFSDGIFVRRHRSEDASAILSTGDALVAADEWTTWGAVESGSGWARLLYYDASGPSRGDSLAVVGDALVRRTALFTGIREERYTSH